MSDQLGCWGKRCRGTLSLRSAGSWHWLAPGRWGGLVRLGLLAVAVSIPLSGSTAKAQSIQGRVVSVGYPFSGVFTHTIRESQWFPILVELQTTEPQITLDLRVECSDLDGDRVRYDREAITIGAADGLRQIWCYAVTHRQGGSFTTMLRLPRSVDILEGERRIASLDMPDFTLAGPMDELILDISAASVTYLTTLQSNADLQDPAYGGRRFYRKYYVARAPANQVIPDQWYGLEALDVVVWDQADPRSGQIGRNQLLALLEWVRRGGHLVVGIGGQADVIRETELAEVLPLELIGGSRTVREFPRFDAAYVAEAHRGPLSTPVAVANCRLRAGALQIMWDEMNGNPMPLIAMHQVGSGRVTATSAPLSVLLDNVRVNDQTLATLLDLNQLTEEYRENEAESITMAMSAALASAQLAPDVHDAVSFARQGSLLALLATFFVASYIALSTLVSWFWLRRLNRLAMSWPIFGLFAIAASFLSLGTVRVSRGLVATVHEISMVDIEEGENQATSACWFGYRSPNRETPTFSLPTVINERQILTGNYLRPLAPLENSRYATPQPYTARVGFAELQDVLIRSTVKQFEGHWKGTLEGTLQARLIADRSTGQITTNSFIINNLPDDIRAGAILYVDPRMTGEPPLKAAGLIRSHRPEFQDKVPPAANVLVVPLGPLEAGDELRGNIGEQFYQDMLVAQRNSQVRDPNEPQNWRDLETLRHVQLGDWRNAGWTPAMSALAQVSFHELDLPGGRQFIDFDQAAQRLSIAGLVDYDISHWLVRGQAIILLVVDQPGPAVLHRNGEAWPGSQGETLYRVRVPLEYVGRPIGGRRS